MDRHKGDLRRYFSMFFRIARDCAAALLAPRTWRASLLGESPIPIGHALRRGTRTSVPRRAPPLRVASVDL